MNGQPEELGNGSIRATITGSLYAVLGAIVAFALAGLGHGWTQPFLYFTLPMFILCPLSALRGARRVEHNGIPWTEALLLGAGLAANGALIGSYWHYSANAPFYGAPLHSVLVIGWLCLWYSWQVKAANTARHVLGRRDADRCATLWPGLLLLIGAMMGNIIALLSLNAEFQHFGFTIWTALGLLVFLFWSRWQFRAARKVWRNLSRPVNGASNEV